METLMIKRRQNRSADLSNWSMKFMSRSFYINFFIVLASFLSTGVAHAIPEKDTGNLGEIRNSILSKQDFQKIYGTQWVLMNGDDIQDSDLFKERLWGETTLPDARGRFLRCFNAGQSLEEGNPEGDQIKIGDQQTDTFKKHNHGGGNHSHKYNGGPGGRICAGNDLSSVIGYGVNNYGTTHCGQIVKDEGGSETRPRCIIVNTFIKVNRTPENQQTDVIKKAIEQLPNRIAGNERLINLIREIVQSEMRRNQAR
jgi:hypothetical protein